jgi:carbonic anhydrase
VRAAFRDQRVGLVDNWLRHVQDVRSKHRDQLDALPTEVAQMDRLSELNVIEQVSNVSQTTVVQDAWSRGQRLSVHGVIYGLQDGLLRDLGITLRSVEEVAAHVDAARVR